MSAALVTRLQNTDTAENNASAFSEPLRPLVSWKLPRPSIVVAGWPTSASTGTRLANDSPRPGTRFSAPAAGGRGHYAQAGAAAAVAVGHRGGGELVLGQHRGDVRTEIRGVVKVFDVGTVDTEDVFDSGPREMLDDVVDHPVLARHTRDTTRRPLGFNTICR